jgi:hypothetical protein
MCSREASHLLRLRKESVHQTLLVPALRGCNRTLRNFISQSKRNLCISSNNSCSLFYTSPHISPAYPISILVNPVKTKQKLLVSPEVFPTTSHSLPEEVECFHEYCYFQSMPMPSWGKGCKRKSSITQFYENWAQFLI